MAVSQKQVRTPLREHLRRVRYQLIPFVVFLFGLYSVSLLWDKHVDLPGRPNGVAGVKAHSTLTNPQIRLVRRDASKLIAPKTSATVAGKSADRDVETAAK